MSAARLIERLENVRSTGRDSWVAQCPAHPDKRPSLSIRELPDGRTLLHDFAGCSVAEILNAVGLEFDALFPIRAIDHRRHREPRPFPAADVLRALSTESLVVAILAADIAHGHEIADEDLNRLTIAAGRLLAGIDAAGLDSEGQRIYRELLKARAAAIECDALPA